ncbi:MAG: hypothetical protein ACD_13C00149G0007 [uncultured bacterium]|nr:MAG: hypothetical protein ACD_13C00149G0007 [uncultured bacterium]
MIENPITGNLNSNSGESFFAKFIPALITFLLIGGALVFFFMLITGAIQWMSSGGDKQAVQNARGKITSALVGIIILFAVFAIVRLLEYFLGGISILTIDIGSLKIK